jgi:GAF domain-containing protein
MLHVSAQVQELVRLAGESARSHACSLFLVDFDEKALEPAVVHDLPQSYIDGVGKIAIGTQCCGRAVASGTPWVVADMLTDPLFVDGRAGAEASGIRAVFSVPVRTRSGAIVGALACHYKHVYSPNNRDLERAELYAKLIGYALEELGTVPVAGD